MNLQLSITCRPACKVVSVLSMLLASCACRAADLVFPAEHWQEKAPAELGLDPTRLDAVATALGGRGCIVKDGYVVKTWGSQSQKSDWFSSAKPVLSTLLMFAIQEGKVSSVDAPIAQFGWELKEKDRPMTFRHLGAMTSGYARPEPPGAAWAYNDYAIQLYQKTLFDRVFKESPEAVVSAPTRLGALGLEDGLAFRGNRRISASVRDFARIAWLWLNRGRWGDQQLLRRDLVDACQRPQVPAELPLTEKAATDDYLKIGTYGGESDHFSKAGPGIYGFNWWFNAKGARHPDKLTWPDAPADTFMSLGLHGNHTAMMPELRLLVASADGDWGPNEPARHDTVMNQRLRLIAHAGTPVVPGNAAKEQPPAPLAAEPVIIAGQRKKWHDLTLTFRGPQTSETAEPNPFLDYRLDVTFRHGDRQLIVPGYFAADGTAAESGAEAGDRPNARTTSPRRARRSGPGKPPSARVQKWPLPIRPRPARRPPSTAPRARSRSAPPSPRPPVFCRKGDCNTWASAICASPRVVNTISRVVPTARRTCWPMTSSTALAPPTASAHTSLTPSLATRAKQVDAGRQSDGAAM